MSCANKNFVVYAICFLLTFNLYFLPGFSDSHQTSNMLVLISFIHVALNSIVFWILYRFILGKTGIKGSVFIHCLILYLSSEFVIFCLSGGKVCLFGIIYKSHWNTDSIDNEILNFRKKRDFAFSMSFLISAVICFILRVAFYKKASKITQ